MNEIFSCLCVFLLFILDGDLLNLFSCLDLNRNDNANNIINNNKSYNIEDNRNVINKTPVYDNDKAIDNSNYNYYDKKLILNELDPNLYG